MIDTGELTLNQIKQIKALLDGGGEPAKRPDSFVGRYCIVRTYSAGVHAGVLVSQDGDVVHLTDTRRLWQWRAASGVALSGLAKHGAATSGCKFDVMLAEIRLTGAIEVIPCTSAASESIRTYAGAS